MNGLLNVLKPPGMTSFDVVAYLRKLLKIKKIGHAGTLDPGAAGVLPICIGNATKSIDYIMDMKKTYRAELTLGISTDTQDSFGNVIGEHNIDFNEVTTDKIHEVIKGFIGEVEQIPPMFSALKVDGKRLYELAREGKIIERKPRKIYIHSISVIYINGNKILFDVVCSKGTYIRTLCSDIGDALGCGGHMSFLIRKQTGIFEINSSYTLEQIAEAVRNENLNEILIPTEEVFEDYASYYLNARNEKRFKNGNYISFNNHNIDKISKADFDYNSGFVYDIGKVLKVYDSSRQFIGLGEIIYIDGKYSIKPKKMFNL